MASKPILLLALSLSLLFISARPESSPAATSFIRRKCCQTTYPTLCFQSLSSYASSIRSNPKELAQTALSVSLDRAHSSRAFVAKLAKFKGLKGREYGAIADCLEQMADTVDHLASSIQELKGMDKSRGEKFSWHISNIETWVSAALTNENSCMDGFAGKALNGRVKASVRARMTHVAQVTSNALALVTQYAGNC